MLNHLPNNMTILFNSAFQNIIFWFYLKKKKRNKLFYSHEKQGSKVGYKLMEWFWDKTNPRIKTSAYNIKIDKITKV